MDYVIWNASHSHVDGWQMVGLIDLLAFPPSSTSSSNPSRVSSQQPHSLIQIPTLFNFMKFLLCCFFHFHSGILAGRMFGRQFVQARINPLLSLYVLPFSTSRILIHFSSICICCILLTIQFILYIAALHVYSVLKLHNFPSFLCSFLLVLLLIYPSCKSPISLPPYNSVFLHS